MFGWFHGGVFAFRSVGFGLIGGCMLYVVKEARCVGKEALRT